MPTHLRIAIRDDAGPPYEQLRDAVRAKIERGTLAPGDRLPPVRAAAVDLGLAPNTVARAYRELERAGWLVGRGRAGTFVSDTPPALDDPTAALQAAAATYLRRASALGFHADEAIEAVRSRG
jgi:DNA-binding transcriptional regulator YhcF (GntR family)